MRPSRCELAWRTTTENSPLDFHWLLPGLLGHFALGDWAGAQTLRVNCFPPCLAGCRRISTIQLHACRRKKKGASWACVLLSLPARCHQDSVATSWHALCSVCGLLCHPCHQCTKPAPTEIATFLALLRRICSQNLPLCRARCHCFGADMRAPTNSCMQWPRQRHPNHHATPIPSCANSGGESWDLCHDALKCPGPPVPRRKAKFGIRRAPAES